MPDKHVSQRRQSGSKQRVFMSLPALHLFSTVLLLREDTSPDTNNRSAYGDQRWPTWSISSAPSAKAPQAVLSVQNSTLTSRTQPVVSVRPISTGSTNGDSSSPPTSNGISPSFKTATCRMSTSRNSPRQTSCRQSHGCQALREGLASRPNGMISMGGEPLNSDREDASRNSCNSSNSNR